MNGVDVGRKSPIHLHFIAFQCLKYSIAELVLNLASSALHRCFIYIYTAIYSKMCDRIMFDLLLSMYKHISEWSNHKFHCMGASSKSPSSVHCSAKFLLRYLGTYKAHMSPALGESLAIQ